MADELEQRVDNALKRVYRDGPEWIELRTAIEALKVDRQGLKQASPGQAFDVFAESMAREAEKAAETLSDEADKMAKRVRSFAGDLRTALEKFGKDE